MGNTNSTAAAGSDLEENAHQSLSRHASRSPSLRGAAVVRHPSTTSSSSNSSPAAARHASSNRNTAAGAGQGETDQYATRTRSRSSSLQGFWAARKGSAASGHAGALPADGMGEPAISSPLRGEPVTAIADVVTSSAASPVAAEKGGAPGMSAARAKRRSKSIELPDLLGEPTGGFAGATSVTPLPTSVQTPQAQAIAQRRANAAGRTHPTSHQHLNDSKAGPAPHHHLHLPIPASGFGPGGSAVVPSGFPGSKLTSPLSSPIVGTDSMHAHGVVLTTAESDAAGSSRASSISSASGNAIGSGGAVPGPGTPSAAAAAVAAAAAAGGSAAKGPMKQVQGASRKEARNSALFSTDGAGDASIYGEESFLHPTQTHGLGAFGGLEGSGLLPPSNTAGAGYDGGLTPGGAQMTDPLGRSLHTALPSYLKIPTTIPSENVPAPSVDDIVNWRSSSPPAAFALALSPGQHLVNLPGAAAESVPGAIPLGGSMNPRGSPTATVSMLPHMISYTSASAEKAATTAPAGSTPIESRLGGDVEVKPVITADQRPIMLAHDTAGEYVTDELISPLAGATPGSISAKELEDVQNAAEVVPRANGDVGIGADSTDSRSTGTVGKERDGSRTPTPTPGGFGPRALTPTGSRGANVVMSPANTETEGQQASIANAVDAHASDAAPSEGAMKPISPTPVYGFEAGTEPESAGSVESPSQSQDPHTPTKLEGSGSGNKGSAATLKGIAVSMTPATGASSNAASSSGVPARQQQQPQQQHVQHTGQPHQHFYRPHSVPLMPIVVTWRAGGREVYVTGTFANEWRSKIPLRRAKRDHTCILHLPPGTHRLKFIVDDRWRVSKDLPTASDGDGNLVNYVEIPNVGPAHPGPLSAPGEEMLGDPADAAGAAASSAVARSGALPDGATVSAGTGRMALTERRGKTFLDSHRSTLDLQEEARRAEIIRRGDFDDVFAEMEVRKQESWTKEIPQFIVTAQEAEELANQNEEGDQQQHDRQEQQQAQLPKPPALPRQLEKVILNSTPATDSLQKGGAVDDNSVLPAPNHVVLNHLTASAIKSGVLAVGTTTRYKRKYVTTVLYKPVRT